MYIIIFLIGLAFSLFASDEAGGNNTVSKDLIEKIRTTYYSGVENEDYVDSLQTLINTNFSENKKNYPTIVLAYSAGIEALKSKHAFWPFNKMSYLNSSMDLFAEALLQDPNNLEIRFMRFSILHYVPGILGYSKEREEDQKVIFNLLSQNTAQNIPFELKEGIISFLIDSGRLSDLEIKSLKNIKISLTK